MMQSCDHLVVHFGDAINGHDDDQDLTYAVWPFNIRMQSCDHLVVHFGNVVGGQDDDQGLTHAVRTFDIRM
jgi:hypothetical protein